jgi:hypothetical protein
MKKQQINIHVALFTNARNEKHIKEWVAHHLLIGFELIVIFDHKSIKPLNKEFKHFDKRVKIINASNFENGIKMPLMNLAASISQKYNIKWMIYLDCDEFLILNDKFIGVKDFLNNYNYASSIGINWLMFGSNNLIKDPNGLILDNYTKSDLLLNMHVKSFVRPSEIINATNPHFYNIKNTLKMYGTNNKILLGNKAFNENPIPYYDAPAYIAHYCIQSEETYINRKVIIPADDTGNKRVFNINSIKSIHTHHNNNDNLQPKTKYSENIKKFLLKYNVSF